MADRRGPRPIGGNGPGATPNPDPVVLPDPETVRAALEAVVDPELGASVVELGMVGEVEVAGDGAVTVGIALTIAGCPLRDQIRTDVETRIGSLPGVSSVTVVTTVMDAGQRRSAMDTARQRAAEASPPTQVPTSTRVLAVSSGKGGVGKSSVTANLAVALARRGLVVGVLDADIWGFSIPRLLGIRGEVAGPRRQDGPPRATRR